MQLSRAEPYSIIHSFLVLLIIWGGLGSEARASGGGEEKPKEEAAKEEGNSPSGATPESIEFGKLDAKLNTLRNKVAELEKRFTEVVHAMDATHDGKEKAALAENLMTIAKDRNAAAKEFMEINTEIRTRYPSRGAALDKKYLTMRSKTTEELKQTEAIDAMLVILKEKIDKKYRSFRPKPSPKAGDVLEPAKPIFDNKDPKEGKRLRLER